MISSFVFAIRGENNNYSNNSVIGYYAGIRINYFIQYNRE